MAGAAVYIATTTGPVRIQRIDLDPVIHHAALAVNFQSGLRATQTDAYAEFVSLSHGVVARFTNGEERYRAQISSDIVEGASWQLPVFVAHALYSTGQLCQRQTGAATGEQPEDDLADAERLIWATGIVDLKLNILRVSNILRKIETSEALFAAAACKGLPVMVLLPEDGRTPEIDQALDALRLRFNAQIVFLKQVNFFPRPADAEASATPAFAEAGPTSASGQKPAEGLAATVSRLNWKQWAAGGIVLLLLLWGAGAVFSSCTFLTSCKSYPNAGFDSDRSGPREFVQAAPSPEPPPPYRACTAEEEGTARQAVLEYAQYHHICVMNAGSFSASIDKCQIERATSMTHTHGEVSFSDTFLSNQDYSLSVAGTVTVAAEANLSVVGESSSYSTVCTINRTLNEMGDAAEKRRQQNQ